LSLLSPRHVVDVAVGTFVEDGRADVLGLVQPDHALHQGIVERVPDRPDRGPDALELEVLGEPDGGVLGPRVGVSDQLPGLDRVPSRERCQVAILIGVITRSTSLAVAAFQATIFWANTSTTKAT
jgi:hypothetical protein